MLKLMKLEMQKFKFRGYMRSAIIANIVLTGLLIAVSYIAKIENDLNLNRDAIFLFADSLVRGTFIVFSAVLINRFIIDEFRSKSISVLFMYPISRKKLMTAKLLLIVLFIFCSIIISQLIVLFAFYIFNSFTHVLPEPITIAAILGKVPSFIMNALAASVMSLIPLYFGMRKHSASTTIITSLIIVLIVCQNYGDNYESLNSIIVIPITLALIGAGIAYSAIKNIELRDVL